MSGHRQSAPRVGNGRQRITLVYGEVAAAGWYRIAFRGGFGWILASQPRLLASAQVSVVSMPLTWRDPALYEFVGDPLEIEMSPTTVPEDEETEDESETGETSP
ncbi:MAG: hypothetical protein IPK52_16000 [Chloroflexi bacterium]|nr:hypothetical protein [Chloroflexota bacterium]